MNNTKTNSRIVLNERRMCFPMILLPRKTEVCVSVSERDSMMNMFEINGSLRGVLEFYDTDTLRDVTDVYSCDDWGGLVGSVDQHFVVRGEHFCLVGHVLFESTWRAKL